MLPPEPLIARELEACLRHAGPSQDVAAADLPSLRRRPVLTGEGVHHASDPA